MTTTESIPFAQASLASLSKRADEHWEIGTHRLPQYFRVGQGKHPRYARPGLIVCVSPGGVSKPINTNDAGEFEPEAVLASLVDRATDKSCGHLPGAVHVAEASHAEQLRPAMEPLGVRVEVKPLPALRAFYAELDNDLYPDGEALPGLMTVPGMTVERVRALAEAGAAFAAAAPWKWSDEELVFEMTWDGIEDAPWSLVSPMGAAGECEGLSLYATREDLSRFVRNQQDIDAIFREARGAIWSVWIDELPAIPLADADVWVEHRLPMGPDGRCVVPVGMEGGRATLRPDPRRLAFMQAAMWVLAGVSPSERRKGTWVRTIGTPEGKMALRVREVGTTLDFGAGDEGAEAGERKRGPIVVEPGGLEEAIMSAPPELRRALLAMAKKMEARLPGGRMSTGKRRAAKIKPAGPVERALVLRVTLKGTEPEVWRRIAIRADASFAHLHHAIQLAMGWTNSHLHEFKLGKLRLAAAGGFGVDAMWDDGGQEPAGAYRLDEHFTRANKKATYTYDFGDSWEHTVRLEKTIDGEVWRGLVDGADAAAPSEGTRAKRRTRKGEPIALCTGGERACPPEDCGGVWGYQEILEMLAAPEKYSDDERMEWYGEIDPAAFDVGQTDGRVRAIRA